MPRMLKFDVEVFLCVYNPKSESKHIFGSLSEKVIRQQVPPYRFSCRDRRRVVLKLFDILFANNTLKRVPSSSNIKRSADCCFEHCELVCVFCRPVCHHLSSASHKSCLLIKSYISIYQSTNFPGRQIILELY